MVDCQLIEPKKASAPEQQSEEETAALIDLQKSVINMNSAAPFTVAIDALKEMASGYEITEQVGGGGASTSNSGVMIDGFSLIEIDKELKIIRAIEHLNSMGYTDDGGWLTRLVSAKNGNINAVLDAITPSGPKK